MKRRIFRTKKRINIAAAVGGAVLAAAITTTILFLTPSLPFRITNIKFIRGIALGSPSQVIFTIKNESDKPVNGLLIHTTCLSEYWHDISVYQWLIKPTPLIPGALDQYVVDAPVSATPDSCRADVQDSFRNAQ